MEEEKYLKRIKKVNKILTTIQIMIVIIAVLVIYILPYVENIKDDDCNNNNIAESAIEKAEFNGKFSVYYGSYKTVVYAEALAKVVISNNATTEHTVSINSISDPKDILNYVSNLNTGNIITILPESYDEHGRIQNIKITNTDENNIFEEVK